MDRVCFVSMAAVFLISVMTRRKCVSSSSDVRTISKEGIQGKYLSLLFQD